MCGLTPCATSFPCTCVLSRVCGLTPLGRARVRARARVGARVGARVRVRARARVSLTPLATLTLAIELASIVTNPVISEAIWHGYAYTYTYTYTYNIHIHIHIHIHICLCALLSDRRATSLRDYGYNYRG